MKNPNIERMRELILSHCNLAEEAVNVLISTAERIIKYKQYPDNDVFIDVLDSSNERKAYVIFHRPCLTGHSLYQNDVIGELALAKNEPGVLRTFQTGLISNGLQGISQEGNEIVQVVYPIRENQKTIGTLIIESSPIQTRTPILVKEPSLESVDLEITYNQFDHAVILYDKEGRLIWVNDFASELYKKLGYHEDLKTLNYDNMALDYMTFEYLLYLFTVKGKTTQLHQTKYLDYYFSTKKVWLKESSCMMVLIWDITELKDQEENIRQKSLLIQEIHHRVKNNLQTIVSLLHLQERRAENKETKKVLRESSTRIMAIATTHQFLSQQVDGSVSLKLMLEILVKNLKKMLLSDAKVKVELDIPEEISLSSNQMVSISLIINELLSNAYEHAFEGKKEGRIDILVHKFSHRMILVVKDDGIGYDVENVRTNLGLKIVSMYIKDDLKGRLETSSSPEGTVNKIQFISEDK